jgi:hypothetical protein
MTIVQQNEDLPPEGALLSSLLATIYLDVNLPPEITNAPRI